MNPRRIVNLVLSVATLLCFDRVAIAPASAAPSTNGSNIASGKVITAQGEFFALRSEPVYQYYGREVVVSVRRVSCPDDYWSWRYYCTYVVVQVDTSHAWWSEAVPHQWIPLRDHVRVCDFVLHGVKPRHMTKYSCWGDTTVTFDLNRHRYQVRMGYDPREGRYGLLIAMWYGRAGNPAAAIMGIHVIPPSSMIEFPAGSNLSYVVLETSAKDTLPQHLSAFYYRQFNLLPLPEPPFRTDAEDWRLTFDGDELRSTSPEALSSMAADRCLYHRPGWRIDPFRRDWTLFGGRLTRDEYFARRACQHPSSAGDGFALGLLLAEILEPEVGIPLVVGRAIVRGATETVAGGTARGMGKAAAGITRSGLAPEAMIGRQVAQSLPQLIRGSTFRMSGLFERGPGLYTVNAAGVVREASGVAAGRIVGYIDADGTIHDAAALGRGMVIGRIEADGRIVQTSGKTSTIRGWVSPNGVIRGPSGEILSTTSAK